jgi:hypothetical protein
VIRLLLTLTTVVALTAASAGIAGPQVTHSYLIRGNTVGGFSTATGDFAQAQKLFGGPYSSTQNQTACVARWTDGLTLIFKRRLPFSAFKKACRLVRSGKITGKRWRTDKGLSVGSAQSSIKKLYPKAARRKVAGVLEWMLVPGLKPALFVRVKDGRVQYFHLARL